MTLTPPAAPPVAGCRSGRGCSCRALMGVSVRPRFRSFASVVTGALVLTAVGVSSTPARGADEPGADAPGDVARYILPPGNYGGLPDDRRTRATSSRCTTALTPLRGNVTDADIEQPLPPRELRARRRDARRADRPARALRLLYDEYGVPHVYGQDARRPRVRRRLGDRARPQACSCSSAAARRAWRSPTCPASTRSRS